MRKITKEYENPLDNILIDLCDGMCPLFKKLGFTPNGITTISLLFSLGALWSLWKGYIWLFAIFYFIAYFFDCMDGHYARKYDQVTKFGDAYDHVKDILTGIFLLIILYKRNRYRCSTKILVSVITVAVVFTLLAYAQLGCQERVYDKNQSETLNYGKYLCPGDAKKNMKWLRYFGMGTWVVVLITCVIVLEKTQMCT